MTIGSLVPGTPTVVTPDVGAAAYTSVTSIAPDEAIVADHLLSVLQVALNVQAFAQSKILTGSPAQMVALTSVAAGWIFECYSVAALGRYVAYGSDPGYGAPWVYASTGTPGIYWVYTGYSLLLETAAGGGSSVSRGICRVGPMDGFDATTPIGKIPKSVVQYAYDRTISLSSEALVDVTLTTGTSGTDIALDVIPNLAAGDIIMASIGPFVCRSWATNFSDFTVVCVDDYDGTPNPATEFAFAQIMVSPYSMTTPTIMFKHVVVSAGDCQIKLTANTGNGNFAIQGCDPVGYKLGTATVYKP